MKVAEHFYSLQGEGLSVGVPAVFLRLAGCNLLCGGAETLRSGEVGERATWRCDTIETWIGGETMTAEEVIDLFESRGYGEHLRHGTHLVITGGEPLLQEDLLVPFLSSLAERCGELFTEVETNGTLLPRDDLVSIVSQWNVSLKLANSGMPLERRFRAEAVQFFAGLERAFFKFVVTHREDVEEIENEFVRPYGIPRGRLILMPGADSRDELLQLLPRVAEWCKEKRWRLTSRMQIEIWDETVGV